MESCSAKLPYRDPDRLVMIWEKNPALGAQIGERIPANYTNFAEWAAPVERLRRHRGNGRRQPESHRHWQNRSA